MPFNAEGAVRSDAGAPRNAEGEAYHDVSVDGAGSAAAAGVEDVSSHTTNDARHNVGGVNAPYGVRGSQTVGGGSAAGVNKLELSLAPAVQRWSIHIQQVA